MEKEKHERWSERFRSKKGKTLFILFFLILSSLCSNLFISSSPKILYSFNIGRLELKPKFIQKRIYFQEHYMKQYSNSMNNSLRFIRFSKNSNQISIKLEKKRVKETTKSRISFPLHYINQHFTNKKLLNARQYPLSEFIFLKNLDQIPNNTREGKGKRTKLPRILFSLQIFEQKIVIRSFLWKT